jgi:uncharacterized protein YbjT (DUF2867 family)
VVSYYRKPFELMADEAIHIIGAAGRSGLALCRALDAEGRRFVPVVRNPAKWAATGFAVPPVIADLQDPAALRQALGGAGHVVSCAHARHAPAILKATPPGCRFVLLGSTRKFTRWPDAHANGVLTGEAAFLADGRPGIMLHPTMIYGAEGEDNVQRLANLLRRLPVIPLPNGGRTLIQPIHQSDVTRAILAALSLPPSGPLSLVIAGPLPLTYASFVQEVAKAAGLGPKRILPVPLWSLLPLSPLTRLLPTPTIRLTELRRLLEDRAFDIRPAQDTLHLHPMPLDAGLAATFA